MSSNCSYAEAATIPLALPISTAWVGLYHPLPDGFGLDAPISAVARGKYVSGRSGVLRPLES